MASDPNARDLGQIPPASNKAYTDMRKDGQSMNDSWLEEEIYEIEFAIKQREEYNRLDRQIVDRYKQIIKHRAKKAKKVKKDGK